MDCKVIDLPLVSIITPIYNGGKFVAQCFTCIENQTYKNIEWVVINDGSVDDTSEILNDLKNKHNFNFCFIEQKNMGAAEARRNGAKSAHGDFVVYLDIDDSISCNAIESALSKFDESIDFVMFQKVIISNDKEFTSTLFTKQWPQNGIDVLKACIDGWGAHSFGVYKKEVFLKCYSYLDDFINVDKTYKDELLTRIIFSQCNKITICEGSYYYDLNDDSVSKKFNSTYYQIANNAYALSIFINNQKLQVNIERLYSRIFFDLLGRYIKWSKNLPNKKRWLYELIVLSKNISILKDFQKNFTAKKYKVVLFRALILMLCQFSSLFIKDNK